MHSRWRGLLAVVPIFQGVTWDHHLIVEILVLMLIAPFLRARTLPLVLAVCGLVLTGVNQQIIDAWLRSGGLEPPHGLTHMIVFTAGASVNLIGMVAMVSAVLLLAKHHRVMPRMQSCYAGPRSDSEPQRETTIGTSQDRWVVMPCGVSAQVFLLLRVEHSARVLYRDPPR